MATLIVLIFLAAWCGLTLHEKRHHDPRRELAEMQMGFHPFHVSCAGRALEKLFEWMYRAFLFVVLVGFLLVGVLILEWVTR